MRSRLAIHGTTLSALLAACAASPQPPVPVVGAEPDVQALAGRWDGSYSSAATGRSGSISFTLTARGDSASGDVVMIPRGQGQPIQPWNRSAAPAIAPSSRSSVLTINFVRVAARRVSGALAPYADPETGARLFTRFEGTLSGDTIEGTYTTTAGGSDASQTGQWQVTRRRGS
ncbi:MAG TPA: hypothetical protein VM716_00705 [Gemmatimonadales bacterium]|nr:hypothetical protein [Gemmatimonadales bacterium]